MGAKDHHSMANLDPRGKVGKTLLHAKYISFGPYGLKEDFFWLKVYGNSWSPGRGQFEPQGLDW